MQTPKKPHAQKAIAQKAVGTRSESDPPFCNADAERDVRNINGNGPRLLRRPEVEARTGLSRSTIYDWMKRGDFPQPVKLGDRLVAWRESDVIVWLQDREPRSI